MKNRRSRLGISGCLLIILTVMLGGCQNRQYASISRFNEYAEFITENEERLLSIVETVQTDDYHFNRIDYMPKMEQLGLRNPVALPDTLKFEDNTQFEYMEKLGALMDNHDGYYDYIEIYTSNAGTAESGSEDVFYFILEYEGGAGPSTVQYGFYYSDVDLGEPVNYFYNTENRGVESYENGWLWKASDAQDNAVFCYFEKIKDHWYVFCRANQLGKVPTV